MSVCVRATPPATPLAYNWQGGSQPLVPGSQHWPLSASVSIDSGKAAATALPAWLSRVKLSSGHFRLGWVVRPAIVAINKMQMSKIKKKTYMKTVFCLLHVFKMYSC